MVAGGSYLRPLGKLRPFRLAGVLYLLEPSKSIRFAPEHVIKRALSLKDSFVNVNFAEIAVVCVVALILFGPEQLPQIARQLGKVAADLRKVTNSVRREWYNTVYPPAAEIRRDLDVGAQTLRKLKAEVLAPPPGTHSVPQEGPIETDTHQRSTEGSAR